MSPTLMNLLLACLIALAAAPHQMRSTGSPWGSTLQFLLLQETCLDMPCHEQELEQRRLERSSVPYPAILPHCYPSAAATGVAFLRAAVYGGGRSKLLKCSQTVVPIVCKSACSKAIMFSEGILQFGQVWERKNRACERSSRRRAESGSSPARMVTRMPV